MVNQEHEETLQIKLSSSLKKAIKRTALEQDETLRTFILKAVKARGVSVADEDLVDRRKFSIR